jgi:hypothetical protein
MPHDLDRLADIRFAERDACLWQYAIDTMVVKM